MSKPNSMRFFTVLILLLLLMSCSIRHIDYDRDRILKRFSNKYLIYLEGEFIDLETVYLDIDNIQTIKLIKTEKKIYISQRVKSNLLNLNELNLSDSLELKKGLDKNNIILVVLNGAPLDETLISKIKMDNKAIKDLKIIKKDSINKKLIFHHSVKGDILIINTK